MGSIRFTMSPPAPIGRGRFRLYRIPRFSHSCHAKEMNRQLTKLESSDRPPSSSQFQGLIAPDMWQLLVGLSGELTRLARRIPSPGTRGPGGRAPSLSPHPTPQSPTAPKPVGVAATGHGVGGRLQGASRADRRTLRLDSLDQGSGQPLPVRMAATDRGHHGEAGPLPGGEERSPAFEGERIAN